MNRLSSFFRKDGKGQAALLVLAGFALVLCTLKGIDLWLVQPAFYELERVKANEDNDRAFAGIKGELDALDNLAHDWAIWDESYTFVQKRNPGFVQTHCPDIAALSQNSGIDLLAFFNRDGQLLHQAVFLPSVGREVKLKILAGHPCPLQQLFSPVFDHEFPKAGLVAPEHSLLGHEFPMGGLVDTEHGLLSVVAHPIIPTQKNSPATGVLLMGRFLTESRVNYIAENTKVPISITPRRELSTFGLSQFDHLLGTVEGDRPIIQGWAVCRIVRDIEKRPLALLQTPVNGSILALGRKTGSILFFILSTIALVLLIGLVMYRLNMIISMHKLEDCKKRYRKLFNAQSDTIFLCDTNTGQILEANTVAMSLYGYEYDELLRLRFSDLSDEAEKGAGENQAGGFIAGSDVPVLCRYHRKKDGSLFPVETICLEIEINGQGYDYVIIRDISEHKQLERQKVIMHELHKQLEKEESLGRMAGGIAHHFNNLLMVSIGYIQLTIDEQGCDKTSNAYLQKAMVANEQAARLSALMLLYLGKTVDELQPKDLSSVCKQFLPQLQSLLPAEVILTPQFQLPGPEVLINIRQLQTVLTNLVTNSVEALEKESGHIELSVKTVPCAAIAERCRFPAGWKPQGEEYACLTVEDNGCGMPEETMRNLFEPFFSTKFTGRGLGLPVVLGIVKIHNGGITVESEPGKGTLFHVLLPVHKSEVKVIDSAS